MQLWVVRGAVRDLRGHRRVGCVLLQGVHHPGEGCELSATRAVLSPGALVLLQRCPTSAAHMSVVN